MFEVKCKVCGKLEIGGHERDGTDHCWCHTCDRCYKKTELDHNGVDCYILCQGCADLRKQGL